MKITSSIILGAFATIALTTVPACDDKKDDKKADAAKVEVKKEDKKVEAPKVDEKHGEEHPAEPAGDAKAADPAAAEGGGGGDKIGVPECDEYIEKYTKCVTEKVPEAQRAAMKEGLETMVKAWKEAAAGPGKDAMAETCKSALETAKQSMGAMGCEF